MFLIVAVVKLLILFFAAALYADTGIINVADYGAVPNDNRCDAEECLNDTYMKTWEAIPPTRPRSLRAFLAKIIRKLSLKRLEYNRAAKRNKDFDLSLEELADCIPMRDEDAGELSSLLNEFLEGLPETEWKLFCGRYWHNIPVGELASIHGLPPKTVSLRLFRTRDKLRTFLIERGYHV